MSDFYPRSPCGERPSKLAKTSRTENISIHALLAESDKRCKMKKNNKTAFLSTLSLRRATVSSTIFSIALVFLSTLSLRRATGQTGQGVDGSGISIHALLAESDLYCPYGTTVSSISIHALLAESDHLQLYYTILIHIFLSTLSLRRATCSSFVGTSSKVFLSTLSLRRATARKPSIQVQHLLFLSTLSLRRATASRKGQFVSIPFLSTLSLRRATTIPCAHHRNNQDFYPRSPCGERLKTPCVRLSIDVFLSTLSLRRATAQHFSTLHNIFISIHALLAESDICSSMSVASNFYFYPRSPCGERQLIG